MIKKRTKGCKSVTKPDIQKLKQENVILCLVKYQNIKLAYDEVLRIIIH